MKQEKTIIAAALAALVAATVTGCGGAASGSSAKQELNQGALCEVSDWGKDVVAKECKTGQKVVYLPQSWGNEQLPVIFAAVNCDMRYQVALTKGAVVCIYAPLNSAGKAAAPTAPRASEAAK